jgi:hypothetical protein
MIDTVSQPPDDFYVGYEERMASSIARHVVCAVVMFAVSAVATIIVALAAQHPLPASRFEFGIVRPVAGVLRRAPYPSLEVDGRRVWLVGSGKFGAERLVDEMPGGRVVVEGSAIQRGHTRMLEATAIRSGSGPNWFRVGSESTANRDQPLVRLTGEIVDSKCFLGVMNPGEGTVHRDCARRCLSGGIPPMLVVRDGQGREELIVLVSARGKAIGREVAPIAGRPITVTGRLVADGDEYVLYTDAIGDPAGSPR